MRIHAFHQLFIFFLLLASIHAPAKEIALTFDDAPMPDSPHFTSQERTRILIEKLAELQVPPVMIFANPCKRADRKGVIAQLKTYRDAGHLIANHSCTHPRFDTVGFDKFSADVRLADELLRPLYDGSARFFRYPMLNEGTETKMRDQMRLWLAANHYRNGMVSVDNDDYYFSFRVNEARRRGLSVDYKKIEKLFLEHVLGAAEFYDGLARENLGRSPKHILLLHERDITVMYIEQIVKGLRMAGWKIISAAEAFQDPLYNEAPKNSYANNGILPQLIFEKNGKKLRYEHFDKVKIELSRILKNK